MVCSYRVQHVQFLYAVHCRHISSEVLCNLYSKRPYRSTCAIYQHLFSTQDIGFSQKIRGFKPTYGKSSRFLIGDIRWFECHHPGFRQTDIFGIGTQTQTGPGNNLVTLSKLRDLFADCFNFSSEVLTEYERSWPYTAQI